MSNFTWNIQRLWVDGPCGFVAQLWLFSYATFVIRFKSIRLILFDSINTGLICFSVRRFSPVDSLVAFKKFLGVIDVGPIPIVVFFSFRLLVLLPAFPSMLEFLLLQSDSLNPTRIYHSDLPPTFTGNTISHWNVNKIVGIRGRSAGQKFDVRIPAPSNIFFIVNQFIF